MLAAIGETFETPFSESTGSPNRPSNEITGVILSCRKAFFRINVWTRTSTNEEKERIENIGRHLKYGVLGFDKGGVNFSEKDKVSSDVEFVSHKDSQAKVSTATSHPLLLPSARLRER
jgi:translation initiation factor 4E